MILDTLIAGNTDTITKALEGVPTTPALPERQEIDGDASQRECEKRAWVRLLHAYQLALVSSDPQSEVHKAATIYSTARDACIPIGGG